MAHERAPAFQFYVKDFISDGSQAAMTLEEVGAYIRLLCYCWLEGSVPDDAARCGRLVGATSGRMRRMWATLRARFQPENGALTHKRLNAERQKQSEHRELQRAKGLASAARRKGTGRQPAVSRATTGRLPDGQPKSNSPISDLPSPICDLRSAVSDLQSAYPSPKVQPLDDDAFAQFQQAYPASRRHGGAFVEQAFLHAVSKVGFPTLMASLEAQKNSEEWKVKGFIPSMRTWFEEERWRQELPAVMPHRDRTTELLHDSSVEFLGTHD